jgi:glycosyltransferase involved in cell wall biosynthesis
MKSRSGSGMGTAPAKLLFTVEERATPHHGGAFKDLLSILAHIDRTQFLPEVLLTGGEGARQAFAPLDVQVLTCPLPSWRKGRSFPLLPMALLRLVRILVGRRIDLVHINGGYNDVPYVAMAAKLAGAPSVFTVRGFRELKEKSRKYRYQWPDRLVLCARAMEREIIRQGLVPPERVRTVYSGIDVEAFRRPAHDGPPRDVRREFGIPPDAPVVGVVANLSPIKGYEELIAAIALLAPKVEGLRCLCVGGSDPAYRGVLDRLVEQHGLDRCVVFAGYQRAVVPFYEAMDVVALPSRSEAFPLVVLEAMARAKPVVATDVGGIPEAVVDGVTGLLVPPEQPLRLADALLRLLEDRSERRRMGAAGYARVRQQFTIKAQMAALESLYAELIESCASG